MKSILIRFIILVAILSIPAYFIYQDYSVGRKVNDPIPSPQTIASTTVRSQSGSGSIKSSASNVRVSSIDIVPVENSGSKSVSTLPLPDLNKKWTIPAEYSVDVVRILNLKIDERTKDLKNNPNQFDKWIDLGILRKTVGDYNEAKNIWEYAASGWPDSIVSYHNLGDLYANYLKDNINAEKNFLKVIKLDPRYVSDYISLYHLYQKMYGETDAKTVNILLTGIKNNPDSTDLLMVTALHYKNINDKENASKYFNLTLKQSEVLKNNSLINTIKSELSNL